MDEYVFIYNRNDMFDICMLPPPPKKASCNYLLQALGTAAEVFYYFQKII